MLTSFFGGSQVFLVLIALVSVPIMLLPKPLILQKRFKERAAQLEEYGRVSPHDEDEESGVLHMAAPAHEHEEEFDFGEVMVHQVGSCDCTRSCALCTTSESVLICQFCCRSTQIGVAAELSERCL